MNRMILVVVPTLANDRDRHSKEFHQQYHPDDEIQVVPFLGRICGIRNKAGRPIRVIFEDMDEALAIHKNKPCQRWIDSVQLCLDRKVGEIEFFNT